MENKDRPELHKIDPTFKKFLEETHDLSRAMDLMHEWQRENHVYGGWCDTNNEEQALLEKERSEYLQKKYGKRPSPPSPFEKMTDEEFADALQKEAHEYCERHPELRTQK